MLDHPVDEGAVVGGRGDVKGVHLTIVVFGDELLDGTRDLAVQELEEGAGLGSGNVVEDVIAKSVLLVDELGIVKKDLGAAGQERSLKA